MLVIALIGLLAFGGSHALPIDSEPENVTLVAEVLNDGQILIEDMIMTFEQFNMIYPHVDTLDTQKTIHKRVAVTSLNSLWPGARIPYKFSKDLPGSQASVVEAMNTWASKTCVRFVPATTADKNYVLVQGDPARPTSCHASVGFRAGERSLALSSNCFSQRTILHELGHILGLYHAHQHPNRDKYLTINWSNIDLNKGKTTDFDIKDSGTDHGIAYDMNSIMHYRSTTFVKSGCTGCKTMTSKQGSQFDSVMGTAQTLSAKSDIPIINKLYCKSG